MHHFCSFYIDIAYSIILAHYSSNNIGPTRGKKDESKAYIKSQYVLEDNNN